MLCHNLNLNINKYLIPSVERFLKFLTSCGTPNMASVRRARNPIISMNITLCRNMNVIIERQILIAIKKSI